MDKVGAYSGYHKKVDASALLLHDMKEYGVLVNPSAPEKKAAEDDKKAQDYLCNAREISMQELAWGRVIQKGKVSAVDETPVSRQDGRNPVRIGADALICAFAEIPTALELFQKARNMDWRNVEERTFATGSEIFDFTV